MDYRHPAEARGRGARLGPGKGRRHPHRRRALQSRASLAMVVRWRNAAFAGMTRNLGQWYGPVVFAAAAIYMLPAVAQQSVSGGPATLTLPPHPTDAGKPIIYGPEFAEKSNDDRGCAPGFSCRLRLFGVIQNNGAVELRATAFTW